MPAPGSSADRNLLFGIVALQMDFISKDALVEAMQAWMLDKVKPLGQILRDRKALSGEEHDLLAALVQKHLAKHDNDPLKSLAALSSLKPALREELESIGDVDVVRTINYVNSASPRDQVLELPDLPAPSRYRILRPHAKGGLGEVFVAEDTELSRSVALKEIQAQYADNPDSRQRFVVEAEITGGLEHPGIVPVYGLGTYADGRPFYAMRFVKGDNLQQAIRRFHGLAGAGSTGSLTDGERKLAFREMLGRFVDVCQAVAYAHGRGVMHRDLKPGNVMLGRYGETLIIDWGLAKPFGQTVDPTVSETQLRPRVGSATATEYGQMVGTPAYMSPEQAAGRLDQLGPASDVYSLGATLYELLTGQPPFPALDLESVEKGEFPPPRQVKTTVPRALEAVCLKAMALRPQDRYPSALALAADIEHWLADEPVSAWREPLGVRARRWVRRHQPLVAGAATLLVMAVVLLIVLNIHTERARLAVEREQAQTAAERDAKEEERQWAEAARRDEAAARDRAEKALLRSDTLIYIGNIKLAQREWENANIGLARKALADCVVGFRNWEHMYLSRLCEGGNLTLRGHELEVQGVAISPDGTRLVSVGGSPTTLRKAPLGEVKVWEAETGRELTTIEVSADKVFSSVAFHPDGKRLAVGVVTATRLGEVKVWDMPQRRTIWNLQGHKAPVVAVTFSPDGRWLASASLDQTVKIWSAETGEEKHTLSGHKGPVSGVAFSPDSTHITTGGMDSTVKVWSVGTGKEERTFSGHAQPIARVSYSPDGKCLVSTGFDSGEVKVWDYLKGESILSMTGHAHRVGGVAFSPDSRVIATASDDETVRLWHTATGKEVRRLKGHAGAVTSLVFSPDGRRLISGSEDKTVKVWDTAADLEVQRFRGHEGPVRSIAFSPDGKCLLTGSNDKKLKLWDARTGKELLTYTGHGGSVRSMAFSPDNQRVAGGDERGTVKMWDRHTGLEVLSLQANPGSVNGLAFSPDGKLLVSAASDGSVRESVPGVRVWEVQSGREAFSLDGHAKGVKCVAFSPDGRFIASGGYDKVVRIWDVASKQLLHSFVSHRFPVNAVAFSPNGRLLASCDGTGLEPGEIKAWETGSGREVFSLKGHTSHVLGISFSPDGKRLTSVSQYGKKNGIFGEIKIWDVATGQETLSLSGLGLPEYAIAFSPDGQRLATAGMSGSVTVWDASPR